MLKKRMTERRENGDVNYNCSECKHNVAVGDEWVCDDEFGCRDRVLEKLCTLEDMIEDGRIVIAPCKVGDTVYIPWEYDNTKGVAFFEVTHVIIDRNKSYIKTNFATDDEGFYDLFNGGEFAFDEFGKKFFLNCGEAENTLKGREPNV